ncbi:MAG: PTS sugar transporter subunit IIA [Anaerolineae bacterium]
MTRIILLAHGGMARAQRQVAIEILGPYLPLEAVDLAAYHSPLVFNEHVRTLFTEGGGMQPLMILTDLYGGTPWRIACTLAQEVKREGHISILTGMNLAMVLEACTLVSQEIGLDALTEQVRMAAINGIRA